MKSKTEYRQLYNSENILENIEKIYNCCNSNDFEVGRSWYLEANSFSVSLSQKYNIPEIKCAGIISALSPLRYWEENKIMAESFIKTKGNTRKHFFVQHGKALEILNNNLSNIQIENVLHGLKTINFFNNIYNPLDINYCTIDRHQLSISLGANITECTDKQYLLIKENTIIFANNVGMIPNNLQASLWVCWKRIKKCA